MTVKFKGKQGTTFKDINVGSAFKYNGNIYVKIGSSLSENNTYYVGATGSCTCKTFSPTTNVESATITFTEE